MSDRVQVDRKPCGCVEYEFRNAYGPARSAVLCWEHAHAEPLREARRLAEDERELRQEAVEAALEMSRHIDLHDSKLAEIERERDEARKLAEEWRDTAIEYVKRGWGWDEKYLPWEEK
jgi:CRISPR/Cas system-associated endonuclease Cas3-HD